MRIRPRVQISAMKGEDKRKPGSTRKSPSRKPRQGSVPVYQARWTPRPTRAPRGLGDEPIGMGPPRLAWHPRITGRTTSIPFSRALTGASA